MFLLRKLRSFKKRLTTLRSSLLISKKVHEIYDSPWMILDLLSLYQDCRDRQGPLIFQLYRVVMECRAGTFHIFDEPFRKCSRGRWVKLNYSLRVPRRVHLPL